MAAFFDTQEIPMESPLYQKLAKLERCAARGKVITALQSARAQRLCKNTIYFIVHVL